MVRGSEALPAIALRGTITRSGLGGCEVRSARVSVSRDEGGSGDGHGSFGVELKTGTQVAFEETFRVYGVNSSDTCILMQHVTWEQARK